MHAAAAADVQRQHGLTWKQLGENLSVATPASPSRAKFSTRVHFRVPSDKAGLRVFNLPTTVKEAALKRLFEKFGPLFEVVLQLDEQVASNDGGAPTVELEDSNADPSEPTECRAAAPSRKRVREGRLRAWVRYYCVEHARDAYESVAGKPLFAGLRCRMHLGVVRVKSVSREVCARNTTGCYENGHAVAAVCTVILPTVATARPRIATILNRTPDCKIYANR
eukprot:SAG11_NODE_3971_length_2128_cov_1.225727_1_plen_223_part_00